MKTLEDLFLATLRDVYYAEKQILKALPAMARGAETPELRKAFEHHRGETEGQVQRLEEIFGELGKAARGKKCPAILGLIEEGEEILEEADDSAVADAGLAATAQAVEHYEISRYGSLIAWAKQLGMSKAEKLLATNLDEEKAADALLTKIAMQQVNRKAA